MKITPLSLEQLREFVRNRNFIISSVEDILHPLKDLDRKGVIYRRVDFPVEHPDDGYIDGYLLVEINDGPVLIPFYKEGEVGGILLKQPRKITKEDEIYLQEAVKNIEQTVRTLKATYDDLKNTLKNAKK